MSNSPSYIVNIVPMNKSVLFDSATFRVIEGSGDAVKSYGWENYCLILK